MNTVTALKTVKKTVAKLVEGALGETGGVLRLAPCWVPRSFLQRVCSSCCTRTIFTRSA